MSGNRSENKPTLFRNFISQIVSLVNASGPGAVHRIIIPSLLSPSLYDSSANQPSEVLQFLHSIRALLRKFPRQLTAMITLPISLFPRSSGLVRWAELLSDGVLEFIPLEHQHQLNLEPGKKEKAQGLLRCHSLPIFHEKGGGLEGSWTPEDLAFRLSGSTGLVITPFYLPPVGEDGETSKAVDQSSNQTNKSMEF